MAMNYKGNVELCYQNTDWEGNCLKVWRGKSLKQYPSFIAEKMLYFTLRQMGFIGSRCKIKSFWSD